MKSLDQMPSTLSALRDELAEKYAQIIGRHDFKAGFNAAITALSEASGEYDPKLVTEEMVRFCDEHFGEDASIASSDENIAKIIGHLVRWQFEQSAARAGLAESHAKCAYEALGKGTKVLEARLAEYEQSPLAEKLLETQRRFRAAEERIAEIQKMRDEEGKFYEDKLAATEEKCTQLAIAVDKAQGIIAAERTRCKELEATIHAIKDGEGY